MNLLLYAGKVILCSAVLFGYYHLFLRNKRFHRYNRMFVLAATALSVLSPLLRIPVLFESSQDTSAWIKPLQAISLISWENAFVVTAHTNPFSFFLTWQTAAWMFYTAGFIVCSIPALRSLLYIRKLSRQYKKERREGVAFYNTHEPGTPFSFFQSIFWNNQIPPESERGRYILQHELFHVHAKHSRDMLSVQLLTNLFWFNPFFHLFLKELQTIHEFLADEWAGSTASKWDYAELLVTQAIRQKKVSVSHQFFHHQIKRRINMIIKQPSHSSYLSRVMTLPLLFALFCAFTMEVSCRNNTSSSFGPETSATAQSKSVTGILPAQEFMNRVEEHQSQKGKSIKVWNFDTTKDLLTAKFENNEVIMTKISEVNKLKLVETGRRTGDITPILTKVDIEAGYPGGVQAYTRFLNKSCHYPTEAQANEIQGTVVVQFIVDKDGSISDVQAISGPEKGDLKEEAVRVITASGKWLPAVQKGHPVTSYKKQPIIFRLDVQ